MRKPDRNNYEIWIIDWIDGNLSEAEEAELMAFLESNPDIMVESDLLLKTKMTAIDHQMNDKGLLKKTIDDLDISQIDLLSVSYLENDLSTEQSVELQKCIEANSEAQKRFSLIQKLRLKPGGEGFKNKKSLKKIGLPGRILRIATTAAAAAAIIIFIFLFPVSLQDQEVQGTLLSENQVTTVPADNLEGEGQLTTVNNSQDNNTVNETQTNLLSDNTVGSESSATPVEPIKTAEEPKTTTRRDEATDNETSEILPVTVAEAEPVNGNRIGTEMISPVESDIVTETYIVYEYGISPIEINFKQTLAANFTVTESGNLRQTSVKKPKDEYPYDERSSVEKFIARLFRERVLNEEIPSNYPIQGYEFAEAWIAALNKVWETEMALIKSTDENGEVESVYFTAGLIKFNSKVKNYGVEL